jgi:hypothetical protein
MVIDEYGTIAGQNRKIKLREKPAPLLQRGRLKMSFVFC